MRCVVKTHNIDTPSLRTLHLAYEQNRCLKVIYHPLYGMNNYVLIWGDWLSCDPS